MRTLSRSFLNSHICLHGDRQEAVQAYLCGRLFANAGKNCRRMLWAILILLSKISTLRRPRQSPRLFFRGSCSFHQARLKKVGEGAQIFYDKLIGEITDNLEGEFPATLPLAEQGKFIIGYYQQERELWRKKEDK